jgi:hypothetical protein
MKELNFEHNIKSLGDLINIQLSGIEKVNKEEMTPAILNAQTNAIGKVSSLIKVGIEISKLTGRKSEFIKGFIEDGKEEEEEGYDGKEEEEG